MSTRWLGWEWVVETPAMCYFLLSLAVFAHQFVVILKFTNTVFAFYVNGMEAHNLKQKQKKNESVAGEPQEGPSMPDQR